jgi:uncharacterized membrane protein
MTVLILGLVIFLGAHSVRIFADDWRSRQVERMGLNRWKAVFSVVSIAGFVLIVWGYGLARAEPVSLWAPPPWTRHVTVLLTIPAFILLAVAKVPGGRIKAAVGHPMVLGVKVWAFAHLLSNGTLADVVLFGAFLLWAVLDFRSARRREPVTPGGEAAGSLGREAVSVVIGLIVWAAFAFYLHALLIGVRPFG